MEINGSTDGYCFSHIRFICCAGYRNETKFRLVFPQARELASLGYVDESKIGIMGGSYGGYMVLAALAFKREEFAVGVDIFVVSNWVRTLESMPTYWEPQRKALYKEIGDPKAGIENLRAIFAAVSRRQDS